MPLLEKLLLEWSVPASYRHARRTADRASRRWWVRPALVVITVAVHLPIWFLAKSDPAKTPPPLWVAVLLMVFLGWFLAYFVPWLIYRVSWRVQVRPSFISLADGVTPKAWKWSDIVAFDVLEESSDYRVLLLVRANGREVRLGVPTTLDPVDVVTLIRARGPMWLEGRPPESVVGVRQPAATSP